MIINQFQGLGDILFCIPIARHYLAQGVKEIIWPVNPIYLNIQKHFPDIQFVDMNELKINYNRQDFYKHQGYDVMPLRFSDHICKVPYYDCMRSKYMLAGLPMETWRHLYFERDHEAESRLFEYFNPDAHKDIIFINENFRTGSSGKVDIKKTGSGTKIHMQTFTGMTLIDWSLILESSKEIHTVGTSINYLIETLSPPANEIHLYVRRPDEVDFKNYEYILSKDLPYKLHY